MKHALLAAVAVAALVFPGLAATATNKTHSSSATRAAVATTATHKMLGAQLPFIRTGPAVGQGYILKRRNPRGPQGALGKALNVAGPASSDNLTYGGPDQIPPASIASLPTVMTSNTNYMIFWLPSGYRMASNYVQVITQYFKDQAHDSWGNDNVDSVAVQYMGTKDGEIYYDSSYGGFAIDTNPFPKSSCMKSYAAFANDLADGHLAMKGVTNCLSDAQLQTEVKRFADAQGWPHGPTNEFFMYTPHNVGSCFSPDSASNAANLANACTWDYYCAYHSSFGSTPSTEYIYANMPWPNQAFSVQGGNQYRTDCDGGEHPNGTGSISNGTDPNGPTDLDAADEVIGVTSHEHNESVTDPTGYGWWVDSNSPYGGYENGDLCAWYWASDGSSFLPTLADNSSDVTNVVNGHSYFTQGEWSNNDATSTGESGCVWGYTASSPTYSGGNTLSGGPQASPGGVLTLTAGDFTGKPVYEYGWVRCSPDTDPFGGIAPRGPISAATVKGFALGQGCTTVQWDFSNMYSNADNTDTYTVTAKDVGYDIYGFVVADDGTGESNGFFAEDGMALAKVSITGEPENTVDPAITPGSGIVPGTSVTLNLGTWSNAPTGYVVQWQHCQDGCTTFKTVKVTPAKTGPTTTKYTVLAADAHYALRAVVTASNKYGADNYDGVSDQTE
ncbi:MAG TPA: hypothetical protein VGU02_02815, partial [Gaiellaceae bacterium]|nr:hypothetical protein [Gaiellaceae bacterium]